MRVFYCIVLHAELGYVDTDILVADDLLLKDVLEKDEHDPHHAFLDNLIVVALAATLMHAVLDEQMREFFRKLNMVAQAIKHF